MIVIQNYKINICANSITNYGQTSIFNCIVTNKITRKSSLRISKASIIIQIFFDHVCLNETNK
jgi:hypothetical protein